MSAVFIRFTGRPRATLFESRPNHIQFGEDLFQDAGLGEWAGFYDWLRVDSDKIVGVRFWPFEQAEFLLRSVPGSNSNAPTIREDALLFFFGPEKNFKAELSGDQAFEEARIFSAPSGEHGILFGCSNLTNRERELLSWYIATPD